MTSSTPSSAAVRAQLVTALELELIGPSQRVLQALGAEAQGLDAESLDRLPSSWYPTGFLVPTETDLSLRCDDTADDDFAAADGVDLRNPAAPAPNTNPVRAMTVVAVNRVRPNPSSFRPRSG